MKKNDAVFLSVLAIIVLTFNSVYIYKGITNNYKKESDIENRRFNAFKDIEAVQFFTGELQTKFESSLSDQSLHAEQVRLKYNELVRILDYKNINEKLCQGKYVKLGYKTAIYDCSDYLVYKFDDKYIEQLKVNYEHNFGFFNDLNNITDAYFYYANSSPDYDFENSKNITNIKNEFTRYFDKDYKLKEFVMNDYNDYKRFLYKTDCHWNQNASYKAYTEIVKFMTEDEPKKIEKAYTFDDTNFYGYLAREIKYFDIKEKINHYYVELGDHDSYVNGEKMWINIAPYYIDGTYSRNEFFYHYAYLYGNNAAEKILDFHNEEKENLLMIIDSFGNPLLPLVASHFNKTYALDHRYINNNINIKEYIEEYDIDKVLVVITNYMFENKIESLEVK